MCPVWPTVAGCLKTQCHKYLTHKWSAAETSVASQLTLPLAPPSSSSRLVGFDSEKEELSADILRKYIFGGHVADYMRMLEEEDDDKYKSHFSKYIEKGITADKVGGWGLVAVQSNW